MACAWIWPRPSLVPGYTLSCRWESCSPAWWHPWAAVRLVCVESRASLHTRLLQAVAAHLDVPQTAIKSINQSSNQSIGEIKYSANRLLFVAYGEFQAFQCLALAGTPNLMGWFVIKVKHHLQLHGGARVIQKRRYKVLHRLTHFLINDKKIL